ncbi:MAG: RNA polymerase II-associated protein [Deltaproteobacteria bacterium CG23_combo_of_CG06-09_8_20_14_all_60_8]|nr:MAG: hypothetical protein AUK28_01200 [Desulfobacterales bacterium CG2_30_60_27]PIP43850.1 MAG: RNA polymerase II-associated protein [Deltaproteobacteria bacterium CG23_combo_of_CG06-09_8_20_14_all_60_8]
MDLVCEKYKKTVAAAGARCQHATEYCKFRTSCLIHFLSREADLAAGGGSAKDDADGGQSPSEGESHDPTAL